MKQFLLSLVLLFVILVKPSAALAQSTGPGDVPLNPTSTLTAEDLDQLNPLVLYSDIEDDDLTTPGGIITRVLRFAFPIAGLILFVMLVWSGFEILGGATEKKSIEAGKQRATAAVVGFGLLFMSYWFVQVLEVVFGVTIL